MEPVDFSDLPRDALVLVDSAPIIYVLEDHSTLAPRFMPLFEAHAAGRLRFATTTISFRESSLAATGGACALCAMAMPTATGPHSAQTYA